MGSKPQTCEKGFLFLAIFTFFSSMHKAMDWDVKYIPAHGLFHAVCHLNFYILIDAIIS
jgi:hypothetical protein